MQQRVCVVGAGTMGHSIALAFAVFGTDVTLVDVSQDALHRARGRLAADLEVVCPRVEVRADVLARVSTTTDLAAAAGSADLVLEAVPEDLQLKRKVWATIGSAAQPSAVLSSNTSSFDIQDLALHVPHPERVLGLHWFNPAHLVPCVEVIPTPATSPTVLSEVDALLRAMGKRPAVVRSSPGFVANRIQMAMAAEAFRCLEEGVASAEAIDEIVRYSLGFRLVDLGPFTVADLAGLDVYAAIYAYLEERLGNRFSVPVTVRELTEQQHLGVKTGQGVFDYPGGTAHRLVARRDASFARRAQPQTASAPGPAA